jgi:hypothetical protein
VVHVAVRNASHPGWTQLTVEHVVFLFFVLFRRATTLYAARMKRRKLREESAQDEAPAIKQSKDKGLKENLALKQFLATRKEFSGLLDSLVAPHSSLYHDVFSTTFVSQH